MKKYLILLCSTLLVGCIKPTPTTKPTPTSEPTFIPEIETISKMETYVESLEDYVDFEVAYLGCTDESRDLNSIITRASSWDKFDWIIEIPEDHIIYGQLDEHENFVYLVVPNQNVDLRVGTYNYYAGEITEVYYDEKNSLPIIYVESSLSITPLGKIECIKHYPDGTQDNFIFTGLGAVNSKLRTDFHMGVVDTSNYDALDPVERPFYGQMMFDYLSFYVKDVQEGIAQGGTISDMGEFSYEGEYYSMFVLEKKDGERLYYGVTYDIPTHEFKIITTQDFSGWIRIEVEE